MAAIIGGGPRKPPRIIRKNVALKHTRKGIKILFLVAEVIIQIIIDVRDDEGEKVKREGYEVQSGVLTVNEVDLLFNLSIKLL